MNLFEAIDQARERKYLFKMSVHVLKAPDGKHFTITDMNLKHFIKNNELMHTEEYFAIVENLSK
jgi:hypothetical protein